MTVKELVNICVDGDKCKECPFTHKRGECLEVIHAIHILRNPEWHAKNRKLET